MNRITEPFDFEMPTDLPEVLAAWRRGRGLKIASAAAELGVSPAAWGHWEKGSRFPNANNLALLSAYTGLPLLALLCVHYPRCPFRQRTTHKCAAKNPYSM